MKYGLFAVVFFALFGGLWIAVPQVPERANTRGSRSDASAPQVGETSPVLLADAEAVEEVIKNRANDLPTITHTRIFEFGRVQETWTRDNTMERESATFDPMGETLTVQGTLRGLSTIEDIRLMESDGVLHVIRDIYPNPDDATLYSGRNLPIILDSVADDAGKATQQVKNAATFSARTLSALAITASPQITSLGGVTNKDAGILNGRVNMPCGSTWNGTMVVNDQDNAYSWYISGTNFGTTPGTVTLAGRNARILQWTPSQIIAAPTVPYTWAPMSTALTVRTASGSSTTFGVGIAPAVSTRIFGQCTWHVARTRRNMGKQPSPSAYGGYSTITQQYIPQPGDQFQWSGKHTAIVTQVSGPISISGGYKTWTIQVSEYNASCTNAYNTYTTTFQTRTTTTGTTVTKYPQSSIITYGGTTSYYR